MIIIMIPKSFSELLLFQDVVFHPVSIMMSEWDWFTEGLDSPIDVTCLHCLSPYHRYFH